MVNLKPVETEFNNLKVVEWARSNVLGRALRPDRTQTNMNEAQSTVELIRRLPLPQRSHHRLEKRLD